MFLQLLWLEWFQKQNYYGPSLENYISAFCQVKWIHKLGEINVCVINCQWIKFMAIISIAYRTWIMFCSKRWKFLLIISVSCLMTLRLNHEEQIRFQPDECGWVILSVFCIMLCLVSVSYPKKILDLVVVHINALCTTPCVIHVLIDLMFSMVLNNLSLIFL